MKPAVEELLNILGPEAKRQMLEGLRKSGITFDNPPAPCSIYQIREYFHRTFEGDAAELLTDILRKALRKTMG